MTVSYVLPIARWLCVLALALVEFAPTVHAENVDRVEPSKAAFKRTFTSKRGKLVLKMEVPGEPVAEPVRITVTAVCEGRERNPEGQVFGLCLLKAYSFDDENGVLELETKLGRVDEVGRVTCDMAEDKSISLRELCAANGRPKKAPTLRPRPR